MIRCRRGFVDGINLEGFHLGHAYDVDRSLGSYLIVSKSAEPALDDEPALVVRPNEILVSMAPDTPSVAAEEDDAGSAA